MNSTDKSSLATATPETAEIDSAADLFSTFPTRAGYTSFQTTTLAAPAGPDSAVITVVVLLILLTAAALAFLLYRYLCHNKGSYRTTGEPAPGEDEESGPEAAAAADKKEYFI